MAVLGTQMLATSIAVFGLLVTPIGWRWAAFVWGYALAWFFLTDPVKLLAYRVFDPANARAKPTAKTEAPHEAKAIEPNAEAKSGAKPASKSETKDAPKPQVIMESKPEANAAPEPGAKGQPVADLSAQISTRAYELYEEGGRKDGAAVKNWEKAEAEVRTDLAKAAAASKPKVAPPPVGKVESKAEAKDPPKSASKGPQDETKAAAAPKTTVEPTPVAKVESKHEAKEPPQSVAKMGPQPEAKAAPKSEIRIEPKTEAQANTASDAPPPQLVKRVHELYEKLGREDVGAVEDWERAKNKEERPAK
jgi:H+-transporting ATPase